MCACMRVFVEVIELDYLGSFVFSLRLIYGFHMSASLLNEPLDRTLTFAPSATASLWLGPHHFYDMRSRHILVHTRCNLPLLPPVGIKVSPLMIIGSAGWCGTLGNGPLIAY